MNKIHLLKGWKDTPLGVLADLRRGISYNSATLKDSEEDGIPYINMKSFVKDGGYNKNGLKYFSGFYNSTDTVKKNDLLVANTDVTLSGDIVGVPALLPNYLENMEVVYSHHVTSISIKNAIEREYLYYLLCLPYYRGEMRRYARGTTVMMLDPHAVKKIQIIYPYKKSEQQKITYILQTTDQAIEKTEALIEKYQQIKAGLMHDLFTRGIGVDGQLRPPREQAPELYHETPIGWIPKEWDVATIEAVKESLVDGPFGSNLKTEHYVSDPGVRVVRLQNIQATEYNDDDRAFVSEKHANSLFRNKVTGRDILIAGLGEDRYPVGRACLYPDELPPAINKADCFRLRCLEGVIDNGFLMYFLNTWSARLQVRRYEQGVTRPRINLGNMKKIRVSQPSGKEQKQIFERLQSLTTRIGTEFEKLKKLQKQKNGLMHDLLTGKVPVKLDTSVAIHHSEAASV